MIKKKSTRNANIIPGQYLLFDKMATFRERLFGGAKSSGKESAKPDDSIKAEEVRLAPVSKIMTSASKKERTKRKTGLIFFLGGIVGIIAAGLFAQNSDFIEFPEFKDLSLDSLMDVLPNGFMKDARELAKGEREAVDYDSFAVGLKLRKEGIRANHPVIMIPGVISTGLESWGTTNSSRQYFRKRLWGSWSMMRALVVDKEGWKRHIMFDKKTGLDPKGIKLRAAQGFDAADFFITGYWIWFALSFYTRSYILSFFLGTKSWRTWQRLDMILRIVSQPHTTGDYRTRISRFEINTSLA